MEYLHETAAHVVALKTKFYSKNTTVIYLRKGGSYMNFLRQKMFFYEYLVYWNG